MRLILLIMGTVLSRRGHAVLTCHSGRVDTAVSARSLRTSIWRLLLQRLCGSSSSSMRREQRACLKRIIRYDSLTWSASIHLVLTFAFSPSFLGLYNQLLCGGKFVRRLRSPSLWIHRFVCILFTGMHGGSPDHNQAQRFIIGVWIKQNNRNNRIWMNWKQSIVRDIGLRKWPEFRKRHSSCKRVLNYISWKGKGGEILERRVGACANSGTNAMPKKENHESSSAMKNDEVIGMYTIRKS